MIEKWDSADQPINLAYAKDKVAQLDHMQTYFTPGGYVWERDDPGYTDSRGGFHPKRHVKEYLEPKLLNAIQLNARFHLVKELQDVGITLYKGKPQPPAA